jgi:uncharacterized protein (DUF983 family)
LIPGRLETVDAARGEGSSRAVVVCDTPVRAAMQGRCPRCGQGALFGGFLKVRAICATCDLDYTTIQTGDGPASFIMQIAGFVVGFSALFVEIKYHPPMWLHLIVWLPLVVALSLALMRPGRGLMIGLQYRNQVDVSSPVPLRLAEKDL